jgi:hypothetical protein
MGYFRDTTYSWRKPKENLTGMDLRRIYSGDASGAPFACHELTLEMVTEERRQWMWQEYALSHVRLTGIRAVWLPAG